jgi:hypothetical protein
MKAELGNIVEFMDLLLSKIESIEVKLSSKNDEHKYKEYMCADELLEYLKEHAIIVSKSKVYKLTASSGGIPYKKVYGKLVFPKQEIDLWIDTQLNPQKNKNVSSSKKNNNIKTIKK